MKLLFNLFFSLLCSLCLAQYNIETKFTPPIGYERIYNDNYSKFLRQFPLKSNNEVKYYNGDSKINSSNSLKDSPAHGACTMFRKNILVNIGSYDEVFK